MATKPTIPVNKKIPVATKQVPAKKPAPAKPALKAVAKASVPVKKPAGVSTKQAIVDHVKARYIGTQVGEAIKSGNQTKVDAANKLLKANNIVLKVVPVKKAAPPAAVKKIVETAKKFEPVKKVAAVQGIKPVQGAKATAPVKNTLKSAKPVVASVTLTKGEAKKFYAAKTTADKTAVAVKAMLKDSKIPAAAKKAVVATVVKTAVARPSTKAVPVKKVEPAKKPTKAVKTKPVTAATPKSTPAAAPIPTTQSQSQAGSLAPSSFLPKPEVNKFLAAIPENPYVKAAPEPTAPQLKLPPEMTTEKALEREKFLRNTFRSMTATSRIST